MQKGNANKSVAFFLVKPHISLILTSYRKSNWRIFMRAFCFFIFAMGFLSVSAQDSVLVFSGDLESQKTHLIAIDMLTGGKKDICEVKDYKFIFQRSSVYDAAGGKMYFLGDDGNINTRRFVETDVKTGQINRSVPNEPEWNYVNYCFHEGYKVVFAQQFLNAAPTNKIRICWLDLSTQTWREIIKLPGQIDRC